MSDITTTDPGPQAAPAPPTPPSGRRRHRLRSALLLLATASLLPLVATVPAQAATPTTARAAIAAALARQGISLAADTTPTGTPGAPDTPAGSAPSATAAPATTASPSPAATGESPAAATGSGPSTAGSDTPSATGATTASATGTTSGETDTTGGDSATTGTWSISSSVRQFLAGLDVTFADGPLTGTLTGSTLTVTATPPTLPLSIPGGPTVTVTSASIAIDESTGSLTLTGTVAGPDGIGGTLTVTIAHSDSTDLNGSASTDLSSTVTVTGVPILGGTVDLSGTLSDTAGMVGASVTGTLEGDLVVAPGVLTIAKGTTVALSSTDGLTVSGTAALGSGSASAAVDVSGTIKGSKDFSLSVDDTTDPPSFTPASGLTLTPALTGSITDTAGTVSFDLAADDAVTWNPTGDVTVDVQHVEISNGKPGSTVTCPSGLKDGDVWVDVTGQVADSSSGLSASGGACIDLTAQTFTVSAAEQGSFGPSNLSFGLSGATLAVTGDVRNGTASASIGATLTLSAVNGSPSIPVTLDFSTDGSFTASASVNIADLGLGSGTGTLLLSSKEIKDYTAPDGSTIDLPAGVTVLLNYQPDKQLKRVLTALNVPIQPTFQAQATLSTTGFSVALSIDLGAGADGIDVIPGIPGGFHVYLDTLQLTVALTTSGGSVSIGGTGLLQIPALYSGSSASSVDLTLSGSLKLSDDGSAKITASFDLDGANGPWTDAFGIHGLSIGELAASIGVEDQPESLGVPLPTLSFTVNDVVLPDAWANAIGEVPGADVSLTLDLDPANPILSFAISPGAGQTAALEPLRIANDFTAVAGAAPLPDSVVDALALNTASLLFAPTGGTDATGQTVAPGASLVFDASIAGNDVHVDASIGVSPTPHLTAHISVPGFHIGTVSFSGAGGSGNPSLAIDIEADPTAPKLDFDLTAQFTDSFTGIGFSADVDLGASLSGVNAAVTLHIAAGQPSYIAGGATLSGTVSDGGGLAFSASGYADAYVAGKYIGTISFSYSSDTGALFAKLAQLGNQIASWFHYVYGESDAAVAGVLSQIGDGTDQIATTLQQVYGDADTQIAAALTQIGTSATQIANTLRDVFSDSDVEVANALNQAGQALSNTAYALRAAFGDADTQVASALNQIGVGAGQIASSLQTAFGDSEAAVYNAFTQIGQGSQSVLDAIDGFFNTGSYWIYSNPWYSVPLYLDDSGGSYAAGNGIIQYTWTGGHNQDWYVLPTDSGYAEIVNRQSGQCLSAFGGPGDQVVQYPCYGWSQQQWYLGVYPGQNLNYTGHNVINRATGWDLDVYQGSTSAGTGIDTWYGNGGWNQWFTFEPAIG